MHYVPLYLAGLVAAGFSMVVGVALTGAVLRLLPASLDATADVLAVVLMVGLPLFAAALVGRAAPATTPSTPPAAGARAHLVRSWPFYGVAIGTAVWIESNVSDGRFWVLGPYIAVPCLAAVGLVLGDLWRAPHRAARGLTWR